jgi:hypothetical protein
LNIIVASRRIKVARLPSNPTPWSHRWTTIVINLRGRPA